MRSFFTRVRHAIFERNITITRIAAVKVQSPENPPRSSFAIMAWYRFSCDNVHHTIFYRSCNKCGGADLKVVNNYTNEGFDLSNHGPEEFTWKGYRDFMNGGADSVLAFGSFDLLRREIYSGDYPVYDIRVGECPRTVCFHCAAALMYYYISKIQEVVGARASPTC